MAIIVNLRYTGKDGSALRFAEEMITSGTVDKIRAEKGNLRYEYYRSVEDPETVLLIDSWEDQEAIDRHHASEMMNTIAILREKYDLHMKVERFTELKENQKDDRYIRK
ncbi:MAG: antibiotic biosynthesis monooxygenase [Erysipelotrichaceae bacterium]|nr:antibiotic biosynthesis monooxygenase [Erysipelotrichaceae bacterium]